MNARLKVQVISKPPALPEPKGSPEHRRSFTTCSSKPVRPTRYLTSQLAGTGALPTRVGYFKGFIRGLAPTDRRRRSPPSPDALRDFLGRIGQIGSATGSRWYGGSHPSAGRTAREGRPILGEGLLQRSRRTTLQALRTKLLRRASRFINRDAPRLHPIAR